MEKIILLGIGQRLRGDDAIGLIAVEKWAEAHPDVANSPLIRVENLELPGLDLLEAISGAEKAVIVDAVHSDSPVATIHKLTESELQSFSPDSQSAHGWGVAETLKLGRTLETVDLPNEIRIIGIEVEQVEMGAGLSQAVRDKMPKIVDAIHAEIIDVSER
ncbi:MAG: hydrogenase maturation protease [Candidatus Hermodarchaeia archaeon]|jgi:hydrogenase maturation protease